MAINIHKPQPTNYWAWGGGAVAVILVIAVLGYAFDWIGNGVTSEVNPLIEQSAPVTE